jgi:succinate-semialdehyde dehydrogenase/glutarate-semialdehyde dehydrogenase
MAQCAPTIKKMSLELGGNAPFIVFDDADLDAAVAGAMRPSTATPARPASAPTASWCRTACMTPSPQKLAAAVAGLKVGDGLEEGVTQGPLIDGAGLAKVEELLADAVAKGRARALRRQAPRARRHLLRADRAGRRDAGMRLAREEIFGPVAPIFQLQGRGRGGAHGQRHRVRPAAYFYSRDIARAWRVGEALDYGMVGIKPA